MDALPYYEQVRYIHVARDGRDACMSFFNHCNAFTPELLAQMDEIGLTDETIGRPMPRVQATPREFFLDWMAKGGEWGATMTAQGFFDLERSYWAVRSRPNVLLVHYSDLTSDLEGEMRRIAKFLDIAVPEGVWPELVKAATFGQMKEQGAELLSGIDRAFVGGHETFLFKGSNGRWRDVLTAEDLRNYAEREEAELTPGLRKWLATGRAGGDPNSWDD